uniref:Uncharacterized protein n=1 Tax=Arundo donax TaxID=35708 RepID=A0A0A9FQV9_ARUDO
MVGNIITCAGTRTTAVATTYA